MKLQETSSQLGIISDDRYFKKTALKQIDNHFHVSKNRGPYRIVLYSHDTMGLGHIKRNILLAKTILKSRINCSVLLISGSKNSSKFDLPYNTEIITLPSLHKNGSGNYTAKNMDIMTDDLVNIRTNVIKSALMSFNPDVLIVDKAVRGALKELDASLNYLKLYENTICVLGLRDILDDPDVVKKEWKKYKYEKTIDKYYDYIWVYGDQNVYDVAKEYNFSPSISKKIIYTGYLVKDKPLKGFVDRRRKSTKIDFPEGNIVLCVLGGGQDGYDISKNFIKTKFPENTIGVLLTGPFMDNKKRNEIFQLAEKYANIYVYNFVPDPADLLNKADRVIAMGGYNTICELISYGKKSLIIPRITPRKEQLIRAEYLSRLGIVDFLHPDKLCPESIAEWLRNNVISHPKNKASINFNGINKIVLLVKGILNTIKNRKYDKELKHGYCQVR